MTTRLRTDWDRLVAAFRDATMVDTYYLNLRTGHVLFHNPRKIGAARAQKVEDRVFAEEDWVELPFLESDEEFAAMEAFAGSDDAGAAGVELTAALQGEKPFRRFRETLRLHPAVAEAWEQQRLRDAMDRLVEFCDAMEVAIDHPAFDALHAAATGEGTVAPAASLSIGRRAASRGGASGGGAASPGGPGGDDAPAATPSAPRPPRPAPRGGPPRSSRR